VQEVRDADDDHVDRGMLDRGLHVRRRFGNAPALAKGAATLLAARVDDAHLVARALRGSDIV